MKILLLIFGLIVSFNSFAMDGNGFFKICDSKESEPIFDAGCNGYMQAVIDDVLSTQNTLNFMSKDMKEKFYQALKPSCMPSIEPNQARMIGIKWYKEHPEKLHTPAITELSNALRQSFPCQQ